MMRTPILKIGVTNERGTKVPFFYFLKAQCDGGMLFGKFTFAADHDLFVWQLPNNMDPVDHTDGTLTKF